MYIDIISYNHILESYLIDIIHWLQHMLMMLLDIVCIEEGRLMVLIDYLHDWFPICISDDGPNRLIVCVCWCGFGSNPISTYGCSLILCMSIHEYSFTSYFKLFYVIFMRKPKHIVWFGP